MKFSKEKVIKLSEWYENKNPELFVEYNRPSGYSYFVCVDNTAIPAYYNSLHFGKGGTRYSKDLDRNVIEDLSKSMSIKNAIPGSNGLYGGAKSGIKPPKGVEPTEVPDEIIEDFAKITWKFHSKNGGIWGGPGCDMNFQEDSVKKYINSLHDNDLTNIVHIATGRPDNNEYNGVAYDENGVAGKGVAKATDCIVDFVNKNSSDFPMSLSENCTVAIQGLGAMGSEVLRRLDSMGYSIVAVSDLSLEGTVININGLSSEDVIEAHRNRDPNMLDGNYNNLNDVLSVECDILIPAAKGGVITKNNMNEVKSPIIIEAANNPVTRAAKDYLYNENKLVVPGESVNFGGSVAASIEIDPSVKDDPIQTSIKKTDRFIKNHIKELMNKFVDIGGFDNGCSPHYITEGIALERIVSSMIHRGDDIPQNIMDIVNE